LKILDRQPDIMIACFESSAALLHAAEKMHGEGYNDYDCHSPFPIHGMDKAMGLKRSPVGWIVGCMGGAGFIGSMALQWWTSTIGYPLIISGKPLFSFQAFIPVTFALTVLFSAFGAVFGMLIFNKLPRLNHPLFNSETFLRFSNDGFLVSVESSDPKYSTSETRQFLESMGGTDIEIVKDGGDS